MRLSIESWQLREEARHATVSGDFSRGVELAARAQSAHSTDAGRALVILCEWLKGDC